MIELQLKLLGDHLRNEAFHQALKKLIIPGETTIADLGSGTGFLSFLAEKMGAKSCDLYEVDPDMLVLSKKLAKENGIKRCRFIEAFSTEIKNPKKVDVVISETLGNYALEENILETLQDAKQFLTQGGIMMPLRLEQFIAPVTSPRIIKTIDIWHDIGYGLTFSSAQKAALNNMFVEKIVPEDLLGEKEVKVWDRVEFAKKKKSIREGKASWAFVSPITVYGFALWWRAELVPGIFISTSPYGPRTHWDQIFLPLLKPIRSRNLQVTVHSDTRIEVGVRLKWTMNGVTMDTGKGLR